jgi:hypothetical protein
MEGRSMAFARLTKRILHGQAGNLASVKARVTP